MMLPWKKAVYIVAALGAALPFVSPTVALLAGAGLALTIGNPLLALTRQYTPKLLAYSIVALGAGMNLVAVSQAGLHGFGYTLVSITGTLLLGTLISRWIKTDTETGMLVSVGTAICGGSAIAAVASATRAKDSSVSVALATVFLLNAAGLILFPIFGRALGLSQAQFGLWSALAIHDTSSVVGATLAFGPQALQIGTSVKLARALWIVPLTFLFGWLEVRKQAGSTPIAKPRRPWFILGFVIAAAIVTWIPQLKTSGEVVAAMGKRGLVLSLFCIGSGLTVATLRAVGFRPFVQGICLWIIVASLAFVFVA